MKSNIMSGVLRFIIYSVYFCLLIHLNDKLRFILSFFHTLTIGFAAAQNLRILTEKKHPNIKLQCL